MLNFKDAEQLAFYMIDKTDDYDMVTAFVGYDEMVDLMKEFLAIDDNLHLGFLDIDTYEYDREYLVCISYDHYRRGYELSIEKAFSEENDKYISTDGFVLFSDIENANKAFTDMQLNPYGDIEDYSWFTFEESDPRDDEHWKKHGLHYTKPTTQHSKTQSSSEKASSEKKVSPEKKPPSGKESHSEKKPNGKRKPPMFTLGKKCGISIDDDLGLYEEDEAMELFDEMEKMEKKLKEVNDMFGEMERFRKLFRW